MVTNQNNDLFGDMEALVRAVRNHISICPIFREQLSKQLGIKKISESDKLTKENQLDWIRIPMTNNNIASYKKIISDEPEEFPIMLKNMTVQETKEYHLKRNSMSYMQVQ
jgi:hypothetical protein